MKEIRQIKIFISCPMDIVDELNSIQLVTKEINKTAGKQNLYNLELLNWKTDTYTQIGDDVQDVINKQIESEYDILVSLMWQRVGSPTKSEKSGTIEEINRAIANKEKEFLIFFKTTPPENLNLINLGQLSKINKYKKELTKKGILYKEFNSPKTFESLFRISLTNLIIDKLICPKVPKNIPEVRNSSNKYKDITNLITEVETKKEDVIDIDIYVLVEETMSYLNSVTSSLSIMTAASNDFNAKLQSRTDELNKLNKIKDDRLRVNKIKTIVNLLATELDEYNSKIQNELPTFSENFISVGNAYSKVMLVSSSYDNNDTAKIKQSAMEFRDSVDGAMNSCAHLIKEIMKWPPITPKFNKSKRETEVTLKNLIKEMLDGLLLLDEALNN